MSLLKTQFIISSESNLEEKEYQSDYEKLSGCIRRPNARSTVETSDTESYTHDFHLKGITKKYIPVYVSHEINKM